MLSYEEWFWLGDQLFIFSVFQNSYNGISTKNPIPELDQSKSKKASMQVGTEWRVKQFEFIHLIAV